MSVLAEGQAILSRGPEGGQNRKGGGEIGLSLEPAHFFTSTQGTVKDIGNKTV